MRRPRTHPIESTERTSGARGPRGSEAGETLIEILIAIVVLGIASVAILLAMSTAATSSASYRQLATMDTVLRTAANEANSAMQASSSPWGCPDTSLVAFSLPSGYTGQITLRTYWNGLSFQSSCIANAARLVTITVTHNGSSQSISIVVYDPRARPVTAGTTASKLAFVGSPATGTAGSNLNPTPVVAVEDAQGNIVTSDLSGASLTITALSGASGATLSGSCSAIEFYGVVTFSNCVITSAGTNYTLTASRGVLTPAISSAFNVTSGAASQVSFTTPPPSSTTAGTTFGVVVAEQDANGNTLTGDSTTAAPSLTANNGNSSNGGFSCTTTPSTFTSGLANYSGCSYTVGSTTAYPTYTLTASLGILSSDTATTTVSATTPSKLVYNTGPPATATAGATFPVVVAEQDTYGNTELSDSTTTLALAANNGGGGFSCTTTPTHVTSGLANYSGCTYTVASTTAFTLSASSGSLISATATTTVSAGVANKLAFTTAPQAFEMGLTAGTTGSGTITIQGQDQYGNPVPAPSGGRSVTLSANTGTPTFTPSSPVTIQAGTSSVSFTYKDSTSGSRILTVSATGLTSATQTESVLGNAASTTVTVGSQSPNPVAAGSSATFTVGVKNTSGSTRFFSIAANGLPLGASGSSQSCVSIGNTVTSNFTLTVSTSSSAVNTTSSLAVVATAYGSSANCTGATSPLGTGQRSGTLVVTAPATRLMFSQQPSTNVSHSSTLTTTVLIVDANYNIVTSSSASVGVTLVPIVGVGTLSGTTPVSASLGTATFSVKVSASGTYTLSAGSSGLLSATSSQFTLT